jgi:hypothetical protein
MENMKFSVSECFPLKATGFSYFTLVGLSYVTTCYICYYIGIRYGYYTPLAPASATGCEINYYNNEGYYSKASLLSLPL